MAAAAANASSVEDFFVYGPRRALDVESLHTSCIQPLCGSQDSLIDRIKQEDLGCRILYAAEKAIGMIAYERDLLSFQEANIRKALMIHAFCLVSAAENLERVNRLIKKALDKAEDYDASSVVIPVHASMQLFIKGLEDNGFKRTRIEMRDHAKEIFFSKVMVAEGERKEAHQYLGKRGREDESYGVKRLKMDQGRVESYRTHQTTLKKQYIKLIQSGQKTIEGRINSGMFKAFREGDRVRFFYTQSPHDDALCLIKKVTRYKSFDEMLRAEGFKKCLPDVYSLDAAVRVYDNIPGYAEKARQFGVLAIEIEKIAQK
jgi:ASC-1-like (ASCH) protein